MREFIFTSARFKGHMRFVYNNNVLIEYYNRAELDETQLTWLQCNLPSRLEDLEKLKTDSSKIEEVTNFSFESFWQKYDYKVDKVQAEKAFDKLTRDDKIMAIGGIYKYKTRAAKRSVALIYPVRYIKNRRWDDID